MTIYVNASGPRIIDADEVYKRGALAVWHLKDIPVGVLRHGMSMNDRGALVPGSLAIRSSQMPNDQKMPGYAAVAWADLQPKTPVPRGRLSMPANRWGFHRDSDGICTICHADDSMWCDDVAHKQSPRSPREIMREIDTKKLKHGPKQTGARGPCEPDCQKCILERELFAVTDPTQSRKQAHAASNQVDDGLLAAGMSAAFEERRLKPSDEARAAWSRELRRLTAASEERERNRVLVDLEFEPWE